MSESPAEKAAEKRAMVLLPPLIIVAFALGVVAVLLEASRGQRPADTAAVAVVETSVSTPTSSSRSEATIRPTIALATPWGILPANQPRATETVAAPTPAPTVEPVRLLGPPPDSVFSPRSAISFFWEWPGLLADGQVFVVQAGAEGEWRDIGRVEGANLGRLYRLTVDASEAGLDAGSYQWQVVLERGGGESSQIVSPPRPLRIVG